jgi:hypothetical protein
VTENARRPASFGSGISLSNNVPPSSRRKPFLYRQVSMLTFVFLTKLLSN